MYYNIILLGFNNYFNRINKRLETVNEYFAEARRFYDWHYENNTLISFNENDGVNTTLTMNYYNRDYDYLLVCDEDKNIVSRWFILDAIRNLKSQYVLQLKRDSVADYQNEVLNADSYIYKGFVNYGNPLLYNSEGLQVNQIKQKETLLKDSSQCPWIVGYVNSKIGADTFSGTVYGANYDYLGWGPFANIVSSAGVVHNVVIENDLTMNIYIRNNYAIGWDNFIDIYNYGSNSVERTGEDFSGVETISFSPYDTLTTFNASLFNKGILTNDFITTQNTTFLKVDDSSYKVCKVGNNYYKIEFVNYEHVEYNTHNLDLINSIRDAYGLEHKYQEGGYAKYKYNKYSLNVTDITSSTTTTSYQIESSNLNNSYNLIDAPYKMFCMPYANIRCNSNLTTRLYEGTKEEQLQIITALAQGLGSNLYDLQILPYCPITNKFSVMNWAETNQRITLLPSGEYSIIKRSGTNETKAAIFWCDRATFNFSVEADNIYIDDSNAKLLNETQFHRIVSPNYNGIFEFNAVKNQGVNGYLIDCAYKPYSPHIHVMPIFSGLYNKNFQDARGLICGGDFSLPRISDAWAEYEINNKNYQLQFERQIESLELQNTWGYINQISNAVIGGVTNLATTEKTANKITSIVGMAQSGLNIAEQVIMNNDKIDAMQDQFNYNLENIQARPYSLTNIGVLSKDFKYWPFVEVYDCTEVEKQMLLNKVKYEGMTLNVIGKIDNYIGDLSKEDLTNFIRAKIIRFNNLISDSHIANDIANELQYGLYFE